MEIERGGSGSAGNDLARGKKRPASPPPPEEERDEWLTSDSDSEEDEENQGKIKITHNVVDLFSLILFSSHH